MEVFCTLAVLKIVIRARIFDLEFKKKKKEKKILCETDNLLKKRSRVERSCITTQLRSYLAVQRSGRRSVGVQQGYKNYFEIKMMLIREWQERKQTRGNFPRCNKFCKPLVHNLFILEFSILNPDNPKIRTFFKVFLQNIQHF